MKLKTRRGEVWKEKGSIWVQVENELDGKKELVWRKKDWK